MDMNEPGQHSALYAVRRARLAEAMQTGIAVVPTAPERVRNRDAFFPYRHDSYFYYLTGFPEPEAVLVIVAGEQPKSLLFCRERHEEREIWDGFRYGVEGARERFGFDEALPIAALDETLPRLLANQSALFYPVGVDPEWDARAMRWLNAVRAQARAGVEAPGRVQDLHGLLDEMRVVKDGHEISLMRRAARISATAHRRLMKQARPGRFEYELEAELLHEFRRQGAQFPAYWPIVASGANACTLHYVANNAQLAEGDLLLVDAGCEFGGYAADITRTYPANGRFSPAQREVYEVVLAAQRAAMDSIGPGRTWNEPHDAAVRALSQGMLELGLVSGSLDEVLEKETYKRFYMHRTGHWLGMDVHDAGEYKRQGKWRALLPGMTFTVEPGLYIRAAGDVPERLHNIGIRIEDDVLVTESGYEVLTPDVPKGVDDIEALMRDV